MLRSLLATLVVSVASLVFAEEPKSISPRTSPEELKPEEKKLKEVTECPPREDFLVLPLRIYRLRASDFPAAHTRLEVTDVERIVKKVNRVWSFAGITFALESIRDADADVSSFTEARARAAESAERSSKGEKKEDEAEEKKSPEDEAKAQQEKDAADRTAFLSERDSRLFKALIPKDTKTFDGFRVYYIQDFDVNGIYYGRREAMVKATATLRPVSGGIDEPLPRVTAHELGHGLGLPHRQDRINLMQSGTTGTSLNEDEVKLTRSLAEKVPGLLRYRDLAGLIERETDAERKALLEKWKLAVEEAAKH